MQLKADRLFLTGLMLVVAGGALAPFVLIGLLGCFLLFLGAACLSSASVALGGPAPNRSRPVASALLLCLASLLLILTTFCMSTLTAETVVQRTRHLPPPSHRLGFVFWLAISLGPAALFNYV